MQRGVVTAVVAARWLRRFLAEGLPGVVRRVVARVQHLGARQQVGVVPGAIPLVPCAVPLVPVYQIIRPLGRSLRV